MASDDLDISVELGPLRLKNPVMTASGAFGYGLELADFCPPEQLGAVIPKGVSLTPWPGNETPRMVEAASGLINAIGLENMGIDRFLAEALPPLKARGATVIVNILGHSLEEYAALGAKLASSEVDFIEVNISCPNVAKGGLAFGASPRSAFEAARAVAGQCGAKPFMVKLSPLVSDIAEVARAVEEAGAAAVSLINTLPSLAVNLDRRRFELANVQGGLSGPAIKPLALRQTYLCAKALKIPVVGLGGIMTARDALEFILVGAAAVEVGTATFLDPRAPLSIIEGMKEWMKREGLSRLADLRSSVQSF